MVRSLGIFDELMGCIPKRSQELGKLAFRSKIAVGRNLVGRNLVHQSLVLVRSLGLVRSLDLRQKLDLFHKQRQRKMTQL
jgi:hypothetical protein